MSEIRELNRIGAQVMGDKVVWIGGYPCLFPDVPEGSGYIRFAPATDIGQAFMVWEKTGIKGKLTWNGKGEYSCWLETLYEWYHADKTALAIMRAVREAVKEGKP